MALVAPAVGRARLLDCSLKDTGPEAQVLRLYSAVSPAPGESSVAADFTETSFVGYAAKSLARSGWSPATSSGGITTIQYSTAQTWTKTDTGSVTVLGYYIVGTTTGTLLWAEAFSAARVISENESLSLTIQMQMQKV